MTECLVFGDNYFKNLFSLTFTDADINSRFVCNGPIHKMLNQLAAGYEDGEFDQLSRNEKRSRLQTYPTFVLNLSCPRSLYDITFEPSKNFVEFRVTISTSGLLIHYSED